MPRGSSFSRAPLLKVSRPVSACSRCRLAKVKCDGKLPACTACEKAGRDSECSSANDQFARGKERSYVAALELRLEKLQKRLDYAQSRKASLAVHDHGDMPPAEHAPSRKDSMYYIRTAVHRKYARDRENSDVNSLVSDFGFLSVKATSTGFEPEATSMTFARLVLAASTSDPILDPKDPELKKHNGLPPKQLAAACIQFYMTNIWPLYPAFADETLQLLLEDAYRDSPRPLHSSEQWLFWMALAIGSAAQSRDRNDAYYHNAVEFVGRALPYADRALMPGHNTQPRALVLLTQYSMLDPVHFDSWHLIGFACRAMIDLGFHQDPPHIRTPERASVEERRRIFYCIYALDRSISMVHARTFSFYDDAVSVELPSADRDNAAAATIGPGGLSDPSIHLFKLRRVQSSWYQELFQTDPADPLPGGDPYAFLWRACGEVKQWFDELPSGLTPCIRALFERELYYSYVYCLAPSDRALIQTPFVHLLTFEYAIAYLERIHKIASQLSPSSSQGNSDVPAAFYTYHDALRVYFIGSRFLAALRDGRDMILSGQIPQPPQLTPSPTSPQGPPMAPPPPPPLPRRTGDGDNLDRSLRCLEMIKETLRSFGQRWENAMGLLENFEEISAGLDESLRTERNIRGSTQQPQHFQQQFQQQHEQHQHQRQHQPHPHQHPHPRQHPHPHPHPYPQHVPTVPLTMTTSHMMGANGTVGAPSPAISIGPGGAVVEDLLRTSPIHNGPPSVPRHTPSQQIMPPPPLPQQHQHMQQPFLQHQQPQEVRWAHVDIAKIIGGGGQM